MCLCVPARVCVCVCQFVYKSVCIQFRIVPFCGVHPCTQYSGIDDRHSMKSHSQTLRRRCTFMIIDPVLIRLSKLTQCHSGDFESNLKEPIMRRIQPKTQSTVCDFYVWLLHTDFECAEVTAFTINDCKFIIIYALRMMFENATINYNAFQIDHVLQTTSVEHWLQWVTAANVSSSISLNAVHFALRFLRTELLPRYIRQCESWLGERMLTSKHNLKYCSYDQQCAFAERMQIVINAQIFLPIIGDDMYALLHCAKKTISLMLSHLGNKRALRIKHALTAAVQHCEPHEHSLPTYSDDFDAQHAESLPPFELCVNETRNNILRCIRNIQCIAESQGTADFINSSREYLQKNGGWTNVCIQWKAPNHAAVGFTRDHYTAMLQSAYWLTDEHLNMFGHLIFAQSTV